jgi:hypothetical protein
MHLLIAFGNRARQGKDNAGQAILQHVGRCNARIERHYESGPAVEARIFKFAEALYEECRLHHGMIDKDPVLLQQVGEAARQMVPRYWIEKAFDKIDLFEKSFRNTVSIIADLRYRNEAEEIKARGGVLVNVSCLNDNGTTFVADDRPANHSSEIELDGYNWDYFIKTYRGQQALAAEMAITLFEYIKGVTL